MKLSTLSFLFLVILGDLKNASTNLLPGILNFSLFIYNKKRGN